MVLPQFRCSQGSDRNHHVPDRQIRHLTSQAHALRAHLQIQTNFRVPPINHSLIHFHFCEPLSERKGNIQLAYNRVKTYIVRI